MSSEHVDCIFYGVCEKCPIREGKDSDYSPGENCLSCQYYAKEENMCMVLDAIRLLDTKKKNTPSAS